MLPAESAFFLLPFLPLGLVRDGGATHAVVSGVGRIRAERVTFGGERIPADLLGRQEYALAREGFLARKLVDCAAEAVGPSWAKRLLDSRHEQQRSAYGPPDERRATGRTAVRATAAA